MGQKKEIYHVQPLNGISRFMAGEVSTTSSVSCTKAECLSRKSPDSLIQYEH